MTNDKRVHLVTNLKIEELENLTPKPHSVRLPPSPRTSWFWSWTHSLLVRIVQKYFLGVWAELWKICRISTSREWSKNCRCRKEQQEKGAQAGPVSSDHPNTLSGVIQLSTASMLSHCSELYLKIRFCFLLLGILGEAFTSYLHFEG